MLELFPQRAVALRIGEHDVRWYGLIYLAAFVIAWRLLPTLARKARLPLTHDQWLVVLATSMAGVLVGGRLGYVLLYEPSYYWQYPLQALLISQGGMAFHGGLLGVAVALWLVSRALRLPFLGVLDLVVIPAAIGLSLGRIGNFINQELYGTLTTLPWGISVPGVSGLRHPAQLYAALKDLAVALLCSWYFFRSRSFRPGRTTALFLISYSILRFLLGFVREPDGWAVLLGAVRLSEGQVLTLPLLLLGILWWSSSRPPASG